MAYMLTSSIFPTSVMKLGVDPHGNRGRVETSGYFSTNDYITCSEVSGLGEGSKKGSLAKWAIEI